MALGRSQPENKVYGRGIDSMGGDTGEPGSPGPTLSFPEL